MVHLPGRAGKLYQIRLSDDGAVSPDCMCAAYELISLLVLKLFKCYDYKEHKKGACAGRLRAGSRPGP